jgi:hypothetical protein
MDVLLFAPRINPVGHTIASEEGHPIRIAGVARSSK